MKVNTMALSDSNLISSSAISLPDSLEETRSSNADMKLVAAEKEDAFTTLLEHAANNDIEGFRQLIDQNPSCVDEVGLWYGRQKGSKKMVLVRRTSLMVAAMYGSVDVMKLILSLTKADVNFSCGVDKTTALHCAASGGSVEAIDVVKLLLLAGADRNLIDANGHRPVDVIVVSPKSPDMKFTLEDLLRTNGSNFSKSSSNSPPLSPSSDNGSPISDIDSNLISSPKTPCFSDTKKEYPVDPSLPDIKNSIYSTDEFRMFSFKVRPCSRAYSHDWTECPFVHPGENARRRDPRKYHYSCVPCPDFRKGACRRGDMCEYAHGVFECWLHPAQYRTRLCKDGTGCNRRVCFFAHTQEELRPLYVSTGSAVPSPRSSSSALDFAAALSLLPGSPSSFTPPMSPSANSISNMGWSQQNVPSLNLPGSNIQSSRLRSSLNARDVQSDELNVQLLNELSRLSQQSINTNYSNTNLNPMNLDDIFSADGSSPRYSDQALASAVFSPRHNSSVFNQFQQQQSMLSPINTTLSPKHPSLAVPAPGRMSPRHVDPISPMSSRLSLLRDKHQHQFRSLSSRELGSSSAAIVGSPVESWSNWGSSSGKADWAVNGNEFGRLRRSSSFENLNNSEDEPDLSWIHTLVKESPQEMKERLAKYGPDAVGAFGDGFTSNAHAEQVDQSILSAWMDQMKLDQLMAQQN